MKRGLTLIEMLLTLGLLSLLTGAIASWIVISARVSVDAAKSMRWNNAAQAVLQLIQDDLSIGDLSAPCGEPNGARQRSPSNVLERVWNEDGRLTIVTRSGAHEGASEWGGQVRHVFSHDSAKGFLQLTVVDEGGRSSLRLLLGGVQGFAAAIDETKNDLEVSLVGEDENIIVRRYAL
jgi:prepilin-type N-terminal cleavage/methylation domain-containing protein